MTQKKVQKLYIVRFYLILNKTGWIFTLNLSSNDQNQIATRMQAWPEPNKKFLIIDVILHWKTRPPVGSTPIIINMNIL